MRASRTPSTAVPSGEESATGRGLAVARRQGGMNADGGRTGELSSILSSVVPVNVSDPRTDPDDQRGGTIGPGAGRCSQRSRASVVCVSLRFFTCVPVASRLCPTVRPRLRVRGGTRVACSSHVICFCYLPRDLTLNLAAIVVPPADRVPGANERRRSAWVHGNGESGSGSSRKAPSRVG